VDKNDVAGSQRPAQERFGAVLVSRFAYNEAPTFAVANRLLVQGASSLDAPFFLVHSF
jgi:hypothetical protein